MNLQQSLHKVRQCIERGEIENAEAITRRLRGKRPGHHEVLFLEGCIHYRKGDFQAAIARFRKLLARQPGNPDVSLNLAVALMADGAGEEAVFILQDIVARQPGNHLAWYNLGNAWRARGCNERARDAYLEVLRLVPDYVPACNNLCVVLRLLGDHRQAAAYGRRAVALQPDALSYSNLIIALMACDQVAAYEVACEALRGHATPMLQALCFPLLVSCCDWSRSERLLPMLQAAAHDREVPTGILQDMLLSLNTRDGLAPDVVFDIHRCWGVAASRIQRGMESAGHLDDMPDDDGPLRIGYVSGDFNGHSVGLFIHRVLSCHDPARFRVYCYANKTKEDEITREIREGVYCYREIGDLDDEALAVQVRRDGIHILVDLSGHTRNSRLGAFVHRPAPLQMTWLGYPNTTGLEVMDYRITDHHAESGETMYTERLLFMPQSFLCFGAFLERPLQSRPPLRERGAVTFGSFNDTRKLTPSVVRLWSAILHEVPGSRLLIKARLAGDARVGENIRAAFSRHGIAAERVELRGFTDQREAHLDSYREIDIALDTFPYNGTTTTCEALWMGVPVVTLQGRAHAQRVSASILRNIGIEDTIAESEADYIAKALALARDPDALEVLRQRVAAAIRNSILCDPPRFTRQLEGVLRQAWAAREGAAAGASVSLLQDHGYGMFHRLPESDVYLPWPATAEAPPPSAVLLGKARRRELALEGRLLEEAPVEIAEPVLARGGWMTALRGPYATHLEATWRAFIARHGRDVAWLVHQQALDCHASAGRAETPVQAYFVRLYAYRLLFQLLRQHANLANLQSFARLALAVGEYENCRLALAQIERLMEEGALDFQEPFLPVTARYDLIDPGEDPRAWLMASVEEARRLLPARRAEARSPAPARKNTRGAARRRIRVLHNLARSGGTLIAKCLGCMEGVVLLSEIHPKASERFNPLWQAARWFRLFDEGELARLGASGRLNFIQQLDLIEARCHELGKRLVVRDWSHYDFTAVPFTPEPSYRFVTAEVLALSGSFSLLRQAVVRHPVDQWLSLSRLSLVKARLTLTSFLRGYRRYAEQCREIGFLRYEDFTSDPRPCMARLCASLELPYDAAFIHKWRDYETISGEVVSERGGGAIHRVARRPVDPPLLDAFAANADYQAAISLLGYGHPY